MRIVLDTNVMVSALLSPSNTPSQLLRLIVTGSIDLVLDDRIYAEYKTVLSRPKFKFDPQRVDELLDFIFAEGEFVVATPLHINIPDPKDLPFLEVAIVSNADSIITGNQKHFPTKIIDKLGIVVQSPGQFLDFLTEYNR